jgi:hypothetical protein
MHHFSEARPRRWRSCGAPTLATSPAHGARLGRSNAGDIAAVVHMSLLIACTDRCCVRAQELLELRTQHCPRAPPRANSAASAERLFQPAAMARLFAGPRALCFREQHSIGGGILTLHPDASFGLFSPVYGSRLEFFLSPAWPPLHRLIADPSRAHLNHADAAPIRSNCLGDSRRSCVN